MLSGLSRLWHSLFAGRGKTALNPAAAALPDSAYRPSAWFDSGLRLLAAHDAAGVDALLSEPLQRDRAELECLRAGLALMRGDPRAAFAHAGAALALRGGFSAAHLCGARAARVLGRHQAALAGFARATDLHPDDAEAWAAQAAEHIALGQSEDARDCYEVALAHAPDCAAARLGLSRLEREAGAAAAALAHIEHALRVAPSDADIHFESALVRSRCGDVPGAIAAYECVLELSPGYAAACTNLGLMYLAHLGDSRRAQQYFERAIELEPSSVGAQANLGLALAEQGQLQAALAHYEKLIAAYPAESEYRWNRGLALLGSGDYARGWEDYEMRNARGSGAAPRVFPYPAWQGKALRGAAALLVYGEQGLGDEMMFASCVPDLLARGISCVIECDARLAGLFARSFPAGSVHGAPRDGDRRWLAEYPQIETQIAIGSLPRLLRRNAAEFPAHSGYLRADPARTAQWRAQLAAGGGAYCVGISWRGGTAKTRRDLRSMPLRELMPLLAIPRIKFISLERAADDELAEIKAMCGADVLSFAEALEDMDGLAALLQALDGVVTVDNTVAHLAGALGRKAWIMLPHDADWRWQRVPAASPWYPSVRLCRQPAPGDWATVVEQVRAELASLC